MAVIVGYHMHLEFWETSCWWSLGIARISMYISATRYWWHIPLGYHLSSFKLSVKVAETVRQLCAIWNCYDLWNWYRQHRLYHRLLWPCLHYWYHDIAMTYVHVREHGALGRRRLILDYGRLYLLIKKECMESAPCVWRQCYKSSHGREWIWAYEKQTSDHSSDYTEVMVDDSVILWLPRVHC